MVSSDFRRQLEGFRLTTASVLYRMPDHPGILRTHLAAARPAPRIFPSRKFLDFRTRDLDGLLHSVTVAHARLIGPAEFRAMRVSSGCVEG